MPSHCYAWHEQWINCRLGVTILLDESVDWGKHKMNPQLVIWNCFGFFAVVGNGVQWQPAQFSDAFSKQTRLYCAPRFILSQKCCLAQGHHKRKTFTVWHCRFATVVGKAVRRRLAQTVRTFLQHANLNCCSKCFTPQKCRPPKSHHNPNPTQFGPI